MASMECIRQFLTQKRLAIVGVSQKPGDFSRQLFRQFCESGYDVVPVHPQAREIEGQTCYARVQDIQPPVTAALLMTSPAVTDIVVRDCAEAHIPHVWMYRATGRGAVSAPAIEFCQSNGISVVPGECPFMFLPEGGWIHRFHGLIKRITGSYPN